MIFKENDGLPITPYNFTPLFDGQRVRMRITPEDRAKITRGPGLKGIVTDLDTGQRYRVEGAACGARCYCDARIWEVE